MKFDRALITGASSGIGLAMAKQLADRRTALVVVARDEQRLNDLAAQVSVDCEVLVADLADPTAVERVAERIAATPTIDLVINNAGFGVTGSVADSGHQAALGMVDVNVSALVHLSQVAAATMPGRGGGQILNVSSIAGFMVAPDNAVYAATKAFVTSFSQSLREELSSSGVGVTCLCPGLTRTEFQDRAEWDSSSIPDFLWQSADEVARAGLRAAAANRAVEVPGALNKAASSGTRMLPMAVVRKLGGLTSDL